MEAARAVRLAAMMPAAWCRRAGSLQACAAAAAVAEAEAVLVFVYAGATLAEARDAAGVWQYLEAAP
jgi:hypothetical protein